ncbi:hypothetical protein CLU79DRAFT_731065 [Phycomyces nitens]|nr:hypothetical protein CLU79DRAFT_731065 [Phycomyces nitens]
MNDQSEQILERLIKQITETGEWDLDPHTLKSIKKLCKQSHTNVDIAFYFIWTQLQKKQSQIRYSCLQLINVLFCRSHYFRTLVAKDFQTFLKLSMGVRQPLPPPVQDQLRRYATDIIKAWKEKYGRVQREIANGYYFLEYHNLLDNRSLESGRQDQNRANVQSRIRAIHERRVDQIKAEMEDYLKMIQENLMTMDSCFLILVPRNSETNVDFDALIKGDLESSRAPDGSFRERILSHGLGSSRYQITIDFSKDSAMEDIQETPENTIVYDQLRQGLKLIKKRHLQQLNDWIKVLSKSEYNDKKQKESLLKKLIDVKVEMTRVLQKTRLLGITIPDSCPKNTLDNSKPKDENDNDDDDDDNDNEFRDEWFEEIVVPKQAQASKTMHIDSKALPPSQRIFPLAYEPEMAQDITYRGALVGPSQTIGRPTEYSPKGKQKEDTTRQELLKRAPVVEWGEDLYYWDKTHVQFNTSGLEKNHRFLGVGEGENELPASLLDDLRKRPRYYQEKSGPLRACGAPLHNGGLCPRRDLVICPFHGKIVARDSIGQPLDPTQAPQVPQSGTSRELWEDIEGEVMVQTGQEKIEGHKKRKRDHKSGLVDVRQNKPKSVHRRLEDKLSTRAVRDSVEEAVEYERSQRSRWKAL